MPSKDRQLSWNLNVSPICLLCSGSPESRDHLFFSCPFSEDVWAELSNRCGLALSLDWNQTLSIISNTGGPQWKRNLTAMVWKLTIYSIWTERNHRLHRNTFRSPTSVVACSDSIVRNRIQAICESNPAVSSLMMQF